MRISLSESNRMRVIATICVMISFALGILWQRGLTADWTITRSISDASHFMYSVARDATKDLVVFVDDLVKETADQAI